MQRRAGLRASRSARARGLPARRCRQHRQFDVAQAAAARGARASAPSPGRAPVACRRTGAGAGRRRRRPAYSRRRRPGRTRRRRRSSAAAAARRIACIEPGASVPISSARRACAARARARGACARRGRRRPASRDRPRVPRGRRGEGGVRAVGRHAEFHRPDVALRRRGRRAVAAAARPGARRPSAPSAAARRVFAWPGTRRLGKTITAQSSSSPRHRACAPAAPAGAPIQYSQRSRHISTIVRHTPSRSQRRPDVVTRWRRHAGRPMRAQPLADSSMSSISGWSGKPPTRIERRRAARRSPGRRWRCRSSASAGSSAHATSRSIRGRPSMRTSKRPQRRPRVRQRRLDRPPAHRRQSRVGMQEQQHVAARLRRRRRSSARARPRGDCSV